MLLYHSTDENGKAGIEASGFARSNLRDSQGHNWFVEHRGTFVATSRRDWWVTVALPAVVAERFREQYGDAEPVDLFKVPWGVLNAHRPFVFERFADVAAAQSD